jgi:hypothetical protein
MHPTRLQVEAWLIGAMIFTSLLFGIANFGAWIVSLIH